MRDRGWAVTMMEWTERVLLGVVMVLVVVAVN